MASGNFVVVLLLVLQVLHDLFSKFETFVCGVWFIGMAMKNKTKEHYFFFFFAF